MKRRIKGTHVPRMALAVIALGVFFTTLWAELVGRPIDFTQPGFAGVMVIFLFSGIIMLATSWVIGLDTRAEILITLFMITLHIGFDGYIFVRVFALHQPLPVPLVQGVVEAYWIAGLLDVILMYAAANWEQTDPGWVSPEERMRDLEVQLVTSQAAVQRLNDTIKAQERAIEKQERSLAEANKKHVATCEACGWTKSYDTQDSAEQGLKTHQGQWCKGPKASANGHKKEKAIA